MLRLDEVGVDVREGKVARTLFDGVSLSVSEGSYCSIRGKSGSGKTTLLNVMSLLIVPTRGSVEVDGVKVNGWPERRRTALRGEKFGLVLQNANLIPALTPMENIEIAIQRRMSPADRRRRCRELLELVGLEDRAKSTVRSLSGGEAQRVAICRAVVNNPAYLLCDEPTGALDEENADRVIGLLESLRSTHNAALIMVTHDLDLWGRAEQRLELAHSGVVHRPGPLGSNHVLASV